MNALTFVSCVLLTTCVCVRPFSPGGRFVEYNTDAASSVRTEDFEAQFVRLMPKFQGNGFATFTRP